MNSCYGSSTGHFRMQFMPTINQTLPHRRPYIKTDTSTSTTDINRINTNIRLYATMHDILHTPVSNGNCSRCGDKK